MNKLPDELIIHVFSFLEPEFLKKITIVCKRWNIVINDDSCWKAAYLQMWKRIPIQRLATSWRGEYSLRTNLLRSWKQGRHSAITICPHIGTIDQIQMNYDRNYFMVASSDNEILTSCDMKTGRVSKDVVHFSLDTELRASCIRITPSKLLLGFSNGSLMMISNIKEGGSFISRAMFSDRHLNAISCIGFILSRNGSESIIVSASLDCIKIWNVSDHTCLQTITLTSGEIPKRILIDKLNNVLIIFYNNFFELWNDVRFNERKFFVKFGFVSSFSHLGDDCLNTAILYDESFQILLIPKNNEILVLDCTNGDIIGKTESTVALSGIIVSLSQFDCLTWNITPPANVIGNGRRYCTVVGGDTRGNIITWDLKQLLDQISSYRLDRKKPLVIIKALSVLSNGTLSPIKHVYMDEFKIVSVTTSGEIRIWDCISGDLVRKLDLKLSGNRGRLFALSKISFRSSMRYLILASGHEVCMWDFDPDSYLDSHKQFARRRNTNSRRISKGFSSSPRALLNDEARKAMKEGNEYLERERAEKDLREKLYQKHSIKDLTEEEMLKYALMLSKEEKASQIFFPVPNNSLSTPPPPINSFDSFPPLANGEEFNNNKSTAQNIGSRPIRIRAPSSSSSGSQRKMSLTEFIGNEVPLSTSSPTSSWNQSRSLGATSSSIRNSIINRVRQNDENESNNETEDIEEHDLNDAIYRKSSSQYSTGEWSSLQVLPHPKTERSKKEEEELQWALEMSLYDQSI